MKIMKRHLFIAFGFIASSFELIGQPSVVPKEKNISQYITINASVDSVWSRWSSEKGLEKFFAPDCVLELKTFGKLEILFAPKAPAGQRGAENNMVLAFEEKKMISFTWDAPPQFPQIRAQRTLVTIRMYSVNENQTIVTLTHTGWGQGKDWQTVREYFERAWGSFVLPNLKYSLEQKRMNWSDPTSNPKDLKPAESF
jgi:uncharacterized protein YndB with AHSA1/START domain